jgi:hypothetical protein
LLEWVDDLEGAIPSRRSTGVQRDMWNRVRSGYAVPETLDQAPSVGTYPAGDLSTKLFDDQQDPQSRAEARRCPSRGTHLMITFQHSPLAPGHLAHHVTTHRDRQRTGPPLPAKTTDLYASR